MTENFIDVRLLVCYIVKKKSNFRAQELVSRMCRTDKAKCGVP
jgi:hypothetical protein